MILATCITDVLLRKYSEKKISTPIYDSSENICNNGVSSRECSENNICTPTYLQHYASEYNNKLLVMNNDGESFQNSEVKTLFGHYGYKYLCITTNTSF